VELLESDLGAKPDKEERYYFDVISGSAERMSHLVRDILAYTTASNTKVDITEIDLDTVVSSVIADLSEEVDAKSAEIKMGKLPRIQGDLSAAKLVFQNLISNGLKYQAPGNDPLLTIRARRKKSGTVIEITDNGIGVDEQESKCIFDPFVRLHSKHEYSGSGIGLAICKTLCERMMWKLSHTPNPNGGTVFCIEM